MTNTSKEFLLSLAWKVFPLLLDLNISKLWWSAFCTQTSHAFSILLSSLSTITQHLTRLTRSANLTSLLLSPAKRIGKINDFDTFPCPWLVLQLCFSVLALLPPRGQPCQTKKQWLVFDIFACFAVWSSKFREPCLLDLLAVLLPLLHLHFQNIHVRKQNCLEKSGHKYHFWFIAVVWLPWEESWSVVFKSLTDSCRPFTCFVTCKWKSREQQKNSKFHQIVLHTSENPMASSMEPPTTAQKRLKQAKKQQNYQD